jgi:sugar lactone lactonase YvrE
VAGAGGKIGFKPVPDPSAITRATRAQVAGMKDFDGGEGIWFDSGHLYFSTKGDNRVWDLEVAAGALTVLYDGDAPLKGVDNLTVTRAGELYVCEDGGDMEVCLISTERTVAPFLRLVGAGAKGPAGGGNELAGVAFSPAGDRMYFSAQRAFDVGATYEVRGPFGGAGSPPPAAPVRRPAAAPAGLTVRAPARVTLAQLRRGVAIEVRSAQPGRAVVALRSPQLGRVPGQRGSTFRPTNVTVARSERRVAAGRTKVRLKATPRALARLRRRRSTAARLTVQVRAADGRVLVVTRQIRIVARRRERQT